jgi:hypothetical protein
LVAWKLKISARAEAAEPRGRGRCSRSRTRSRSRAEAAAFGDRLQRVVVAGVAVDRRREIAAVLGPMRASTDAGRW